MPIFESTKTYGHDVGLSCCFRQPKAKSHCSYLHGYALAFKFTFGCEELDENNWVVDFGGLKQLKDWLRSTFDHTTVISQADPHLGTFKRLDRQGLIDLKVLDAVGIEQFALQAFNKAGDIVETITNHRSYVISVECFEHGANSAIVRRQE